MEIKAEDLYERLSDIKDELHDLITTADDLTSVPVIAIVDKIEDLSNTIDDIATEIDNLIDNK